MLQIINCCLAWDFRDDYDVQTVASKLLSVLHLFGVRRIGFGL